MKAADAAMFAAADQRLIDVSQWVRESPRFLLNLWRGIEWPPLRAGEALCVFPVDLSVGDAPEGRVLFTDDIPVEYVTWRGRAS